MRLRGFGFTTALSGVCAVAFSACVTLHDDRTPQERGASGLMDNALFVKGPAQDRCVKLKHSSLRGSCDDAKELALRYVRALSTTDTVCLDGGFGDTPGAACQARGWVADTGPDKVLIEVRNPQPGSRWYEKSGYQIWFQESALVDLYLADRGY